jgi:hypothetical protein
MRDAPSIGHRYRYEPINNAERKFGAMVRANRLRIVVTTAAPIKAPYSIPFYEQAYQAVGTIKRIFQIPCAIDPSLYVETGVLSLIKAFGTVISPDLKEAFHMIGGRSLVCHIKGSIIEASEISQADQGPATRFLFKASEFIDLAVWDLFLMSVAAEGLMNWHSQLLKYAGCTNKTNPNNGSGSAYVGAVSDDGVWQGCDFSFPNYSKYGPAGPAQIIVDPGHTGTCSASVQYKDFGGKPVSTNSRIWSSGRAGQFDFDTNADGGDSSSRRTHVWWSGVASTLDSTTIDAQFQYIGPSLPLGECFPDSDTMTCFIHSPDP